MSASTRAPILDYSSAYSATSSSSSTTSLAVKPAVRALPIYLYALITCTQTATPPVLASQPSAVQVCFLMDCTGSMGSYIANTRAKISEIIAEVHMAVMSPASDLNGLLYR